MFFSAILTKGNISRDFLFVSVDDEDLLIWGLLLKDKRANSFLLELIPIIKRGGGAKMILAQILFQVYACTLKDHLQSLQIRMRRLILFVISLKVRCTNLQF